MASISSSSTSNAQQNSSLSYRINPLPSGAHFASLASNLSGQRAKLVDHRITKLAVNSRAGTPMHSAISSSSPFSLTHSSLQVNTLCVLQHTTRLPFLTGFHRALETGLLWSNTLRNRGTNSCCGEGKSYMKTAVGTFSRWAVSIAESRKQNHRTKTDEQ